MSDAIVNRTNDIGQAVRRLERERKLRMFRFPEGIQMVAMYPKTIVSAFSKDVIAGFVLDMTSGRIVIVHAAERGSLSRMAQTVHALLVPFFPSIGLDGREMIINAEDRALLADFLPLMNGAVS